MRLPRVARAVLALEVRAQVHLVEVHGLRALREEGLARELIRTVQESRKQAGLEVSDRITLRIVGSAPVEQALQGHKTLIMAETLASAWGEDGFEGSFDQSFEVDGERWTIWLGRDD